jgi:hypothetical protein
MKETTEKTAADFQVGDQVHYGVSSSNGRSISFGTREGVIAQLGNAGAWVRLRNNHQKFVNYSRLRKHGEKTEAHEVFDAMTETRKTK